MKGACAQMLSAQADVRNVDVRRQVDVVQPNKSKYNCKCKQSWVTRIVTMPFGKPVGLILIHANGKSAPLRHSDPAEKKASYRILKPSYLASWLAKCWQVWSKLNWQTQSLEDHGRRQSPCRYGRKYGNRHSGLATYICQNTALEELQCMEEKEATTARVKHRQPRRIELQSWPVPTKASGAKRTSEQRVSAIATVFCY